MNSSSCSNNCNGRIKKSTTTLDYTIVPDPVPANKGLLGNYYRLKYGPGDKTIVREELAEAKKERKKRRIALAAFIQITDIHIIDAASAGRAAFLAQYIPEAKELADSFRPQEGLSLQVAEAMVRKINSIKTGPKTGKKLEFIISCGDNADSMQQNELQNYINVLDGTMVHPNPATPGKYIGVQDDVPTVNFQAFYHPNDLPMTDLYKAGYGFPNYSNILNVAARPFKATGLDLPWYTAFGNHDSCKLGNYGVGSFAMLKLLNQLSTGTLPEGLGSKLVQAVTVPQAEALAIALAEQNADATFEIIKNSVLREIPMSEKRLLFTPPRFISMHFDTTKCPGILGHGFTEENIINDTLYYHLKVSDPLDGFVLNTCNPSGNIDDPSEAPNGSIGSIQLGWLEEQLRARHSSYYNTQGQIVYTDNCDKLCMIFSHHNHTTMNNIFNTLDAADNDPQKIAGPEFIRTIQRYPNVILWVNGHTHRNIITPLYSSTCRSEKGKYEYTGFWEINTCSFIDSPQESRIIEVADNQDGTLSIFGTIIDHLSPPSVKAEGPEYSITEMASISRELAINDPFNDPKTRGGTPKDRNVELLINNPLCREGAKTCKECSENKD